MDNRLPLFSQTSPRAALFCDDEPQQTRGKRPSQQMSEPQIAPTSSSIIRSVDADAADGSASDSSDDELLLGAFASRPTDAPRLRSRQLHSNTQYHPAPAERVTYGLHPTNFMPPLHATTARHLFPARPLRDRGVLPAPYWRA